MSTISSPPSDDRDSSLSSPDHRRFTDDNKIGYSRSDRFTFNLNLIGAK